MADPEFMQGAPYEPPINIFVRGDDMAALQRLSERDRQPRSARFRAPWTSSSTLESGQPEMVARVNRSLAADLGFSVGTVAIAAARHGRGHRADPAARRRPEHDIRVRLAPEYPQRLPTAIAAHAALLADAARSCAPATSCAFEPGVGPEQHRPRAAPPAGQDRHRPGDGLRARRRDGRRRRR